MSKNGYDMIYLAACALHGEVPETERVLAMDLTAVYRTAKFHAMQSITYTALERWFAAGNDAAGVLDSDIQRKWSEAKSKAIRKNILFDTEREKLFTYLDGQNVWYMSLKGVILQGYYPEYGMRQMTDNDILFDADHRKTVQDYFTGNGYEIGEADDDSHDVYLKPPVYNFEMHFSLYRASTNQTRYQYYKDIRERLFPSKSGHPLEYRFTPEDFYIYCTAHAWKHFSSMGIGIRSLMDVYVYTSAPENSLDWEYIEAECKKLDMKEFEQSARSLAEKLFCTSWKTLGTPEDDLSENEHALAAFYLTSGANGTAEQAVIQKLRGGSVQQKITFGGKVRYVFRRVFPDAAFCQKYYPFFYKHKILYPVLPFYRAVRGLVLAPGKLWKEWKLLWKTKK